MRLLDLYSGAGGAAMGYHRAGFDVTGVDIAPQRHYPFPHVVSDALEYLAAHGSEFDVVHASPPCRDFTHLTNARGVSGRTGGLLAATRDALKALGHPYVIENVPGAPMIGALVLCGSEFGLGAEGARGFMRLRRHRLFESNVFLMGAGGCTCASREPGRLIGVYGHGTGGGRGWNGFTAAARTAMGIDWMNRGELSQAIPPAMTQFIGEQLIEWLK